MGETGKALGVYQPPAPDALRGKAPIPNELSDSFSTHPEIPRCIRDSDKRHRDEYYRRTKNN